MFYSGRMNTIASVLVASQLRVQALAPTLIRIEEAGPKGFEDRPTFCVVNRDWPGAALEPCPSSGGTCLRLGEFTITVERLQPRIADVRIRNQAGTLVFDGAIPVPAKRLLPVPSAAADGWAFADLPRMVPPPWGALPPPDGPSAGWDLTNPARDIYVFLPGAGGYRQLAADFLRLTGPIPIPPLCAFGLIDSRYYPYRQDEALATIDEYQRRGIPLDIFVLDTDWRVGASHGYEINTELFPDLPGFIKAVHERGVRVMLNDHPEPVAPAALDPAELRYRAEGLSKLLAMGVDYWWFDRNWHTALLSPAPELGKETWGMRVYHDVTQHHRPGLRPLIMSNVDGIDSGYFNAPSHPAAHRYPIWWTGDTRAAWDHLQRAVSNAVNSGVLSLLPYVSDDLGGHHDTPPAELYIRFMQYGALSPVCRPHCSYKLHRFPWKFGEEAERIVVEYVRLRYRLLPTIYAAARAAFTTGTPMLRRCDLEWPQHPEAADASQYLLGPDLLVAPVVQAAVPLTPVPTAMLRAASGAPGLDAAYYGNDRLQGDPAFRSVEPEVNHGWFGRPPAEGLPQHGFSARWTGTLGPIPASGSYRLGVRTDDGARLRLDDRVLIDDFENPGPVYKWADLDLVAGRSYAVELEYRSYGTWHTMFEFLWGRPEQPATTRSLWIPPGTWFDAWTGQAFSGPRHHEQAAPLTQVPMLARGGGMVFSIPLRQNAGQAQWPEVAVDLFCTDQDHVTTRELYEDDGNSNAYLDGGFRSTRLEFISSGPQRSLSVAATEGRLEAAAERHWTFRFHGLPAGAVRVLLNGQEMTAARWTQSHGLLPFGPLSADIKPGRTLEFAFCQPDVSAPLHLTLIPAR